MLIFVVCVYDVGIKIFFVELVKKIVEMNIILI